MNRTFLFFLLRVIFTITRNTGVIKLNTIFREERLGLTHKRPSYRPTGTHLSPRFIGRQINFIIINRQANSLYSLIADGQYRATPLGRDKWKTRIGSNASLQRNCNKEGFNAVDASSDYSKARIGILGNNGNNCSTCDSRIGFGTGGYRDDSSTCGNEALAKFEVIPLFCIEHPY